MTKEENAVQNEQPAWGSKVMGVPEKETETFFLLALEYALLGKIRLINNSD